MTPGSRLIIVAPGVVLRLFITQRLLADRPPRATDQSLMVWPSALAETPEQEERGEYERGDKPIFRPLTGTSIDLRRLRDLVR